MNSAPSDQNYRSSHDSIDDSVKDANVTSVNVNNLAINHEPFGATVEHNCNYNSSCNCHINTKISNITSDEITILSSTSSEGNQRPNACANSESEMTTELSPTKVAASLATASNELSIPMINALEHLSPLEFDKQFVQLQQQHFQKFLPLLFLQSEQLSSNLQHIQEQLLLQNKELLQQYLMQQSVQPLVTNQTTEVNVNVSINQIQSVGAAEFQNHFQGVQQTSQMQQSQQLQTLKNQTRHINELSVQRACQINHNQNQALQNNKISSNNINGNTNSKITSNNGYNYNTNESTLLSHHYLFNAVTLPTEPNSEIKIDKKQSEQYVKSIGNRIRNYDANEDTVQWFLNNNLIHGIKKFTSKIFGNSDDIIGKASYDTIVFNGYAKHDGNIKHAAIKRTSNNLYEKFMNEVGILRLCNHDNIIQYYLHQSDEHNSYIALELADMTLNDYVKSQNKFQYPTAIEMLYQISEGLKYLHSINCIHCDIKPTNILISLLKKKAMIADFGNSKFSNSEYQMSIVEGADGYIAPEVLKSIITKIKYSPAKPHDIHPFGCLCYYVMSNGDNPFGDEMHCQSNIVDGFYNMEALLNDESVNYYNLIESMINVNGSERPTIETVIKHPMFWNCEKSLDYLIAVSNRIRKEMKNSQIILNLEAGSECIIKNRDSNGAIINNWIENISRSNCFSDELKFDLNHHKYNGTLISDLIHAVINTCQNCDEFMNVSGTSIGITPIEIFNYFMKKFPRLLIHTYVTLQCCKNESEFMAFYDSNSNYLFQRSKISLSEI